MISAGERAKPLIRSGGKKGGTMFPRVSLFETLLYARKLVGKTHTGPQSQDVILMGVIGSKHSKGQLAMSALKQYGLMTGDVKSNFTATDLARRIASTPDDEVAPLFGQAILKPAVFKTLFETFHGDTVSKGRLKQRAADLNVHPEETSNCIEMYISGMLKAGLITVAGEQITHRALSYLSAPITSGVQLGSVSEEAEESAHTQDEFNIEVDADVLGTDQREKKQLVDPVLDKGSYSSAPRAVFNVNVTLDSSLDIEKLQKQLELLKRFGAI